MEKKNCNLSIKETKGKDKKLYKNMVISLPSGLEFQVKLAFYNRKLAYRIEKELEESK